MNIVVAFNGSEASKRALAQAKQHALNFREAKVFIVTSLVGDVNEQLNSLEHCERQLVEAKTECEDDKIACETEVVSQGTSAGEAIVAFADRNGADEIIIGIQKTSKVGKLLFGSTAQYVILHAKCPVVTVH